MTIAPALAAESASGITINGEVIALDKARELVRMLYDDAYKIAGVFHGMNRSAKFRVNWPDEYKYAESCWKDFVQAARQMYTEALADPKRAESEKRKMFLALVIERKVAQGQEQDLRLQLFPNTQQFEGDRAENKNIAEKFGTKPNLRAALMNSIATGATIKPN